MNPDNWTDRKKHFEAALDADQVESRAVVTGKATVDDGLIDEKMSGIIDDSLSEPGNSWEERQMVLENRSGAVSEELLRRADVMKDAYPFVLSHRSALQYRPSKTGVYEFCLAAAANPTGFKQSIPKASAIFEFIARDILKVFFGSGAVGFRSGHPPYDFEKRGVRPRENFEALNKACGEWNWSPQPGFPPDPDPKDLKDGGVDVVVWKAWADRRPAKLFALGNCACGKNDIEGKSRELQVKRLHKWLRASHVEPLRCFLLAHHLPNDQELIEISAQAGLVFDRARIVLIAESDPAAVKSAEGFNYHDLAKIYSMLPILEPIPGRRPRKGAGAPRSR